MKDRNLGRGGEIRVYSRDEMKSAKRKDCEERKGRSRNEAR